MNSLNNKIDTKKSNESKKIIMKAFDRRAGYFSNVYCFKFEEVINRIIELSKANQDNLQSVLDLGGGTGIISNAISDLNKGIIINIDLSLGMLKQNKKNIINKVQANGEYIPLKNKSMDKVICRQTLHYMEDFNLVFSEIKRILKPGGKIIIAQMTSKGKEDYAYWKELMELRNPYRKHFFSGNDLELELNKSQFEVINKELIGMKQSLKAWSKTILVNRKKIREHFEYAPEYYRQLHDFQDTKDDLIFTTYWTIISARMD